MNGTFGIISLQILILSKERAINYYPRERSIAEKNITKKSTYLLKQLKTFHTTQFFVMTEVHLGSVTKLKS